MNLTRKSAALRLLTLSVLLGIAPFNIANAQSDANLLTLKRDLAGVLGEVHYIRTLCNGPSDQFWRNYMRDFLTHEAESESLRAMYIKAFNRGYKFQSEQLFACNTQTVSLEKQLASKGRKIAETIAVKHMQ